LNVKLWCWWSTNFFLVFIFFFFFNVVINLRSDMCVSSVYTYWNLFCRGLVALISSLKFQCLCSDFLLLLLLVTCHAMVSMVDMLRFHLFIYFIYFLCNMSSWIIDWCMLSFNFYSLFPFFSVFFFIHEGE
jgi:hypothetical protein